MKSSVFTKDNILDYWKKFYPEVDRKELEELISSDGSVDLNELEESYSQYDDKGDFDAEEYADFDYCSSCDDLDRSLEGKYRLYSPVIMPILNKVLKELADKCRGRQIIINEHFLNNAAGLMFSKASGLMFRSIVYEYNYLSQNGRLDDPDIKSRQEFFIKKYCSERSNVLRFYEEYQNIIKLTYLKLDEERKMLIEVLDRTELNIEEISRRFGIDICADRITAVKTGSGDTHNHGRSVADIRTESGRHFLYKPHQMKIDLSFRELLDWLSDECEDIHDHMTPEIISGEDYGFSGFVEYRECSDENEVRSFYERSGELLGILYSLNGSDMHFENIISCGEYPVLIDLETLLQPDLIIDEENGRNSSRRLAIERYASSVVTIGMLPVYVNGKLDIGGLSAFQEQKSTIKSDFVTDENGDEIHIERRYGIMRPEKNNPSCNGSMADAQNYSNEICNGFRNVYGWMMNNKEKYISKIGELFTGLEGRVIIRPTFSYMQLLNIALNQDFARKEFERRLILHRIFINEYKRRPEITLSEYEDLLHGDIPYFTFRIGDSRLYKDGRPVAERAVIEPVLSNISAKIRSFGKEDFERQLELIRYSFITRKDLSEVTGISILDHNIDTGKWLSTAEDIGKLIIDNAIEGRSDSGEKDASWICVTVEGFEEDVWVPSVLGSELYNGNCGIALFLTQLWRITGRREYLEYAEMALRSAAADYRPLYSESDLSIGAFTGISGLAYSAGHIAALTGSEEWKETAEEALKVCADHAPGDRYHDIISGSAGALAVTLGMKDKLFSGSREVTDAFIRRFTDSLAASAVNVDGSVTWEQPSGVRYTGFAHGNSGIHPYLFRAGKIIGDERCSELTGDSLRFERSCITDDRDGWHRGDKDKKVTHLWCHGSSGILLSKLLLFRDGYRDGMIENEIISAVQTVQKNGFGKSPTYCHGDLGNLSVIDLAGRTLDNAMLRNSVFNTFNDLYTGTLSRNWKKKELKSCNSYGLMIGLSGWGYSLLSHYTDFEIPQFLWLE